MAGGECVVVGLERLLALLDDTLDAALADAHRQAAHGGGLRHREDVHRLDGDVLRVAEALRHGDAAGVAEDLGVDLDALKRQRLGVRAGEQAGFGLLDCSSGFHFVLPPLWTISLKALASVASWRAESGGLPPATCNS